MCSQLPDTQTIDNVVYSQDVEDVVWGILYSTRRRFKTLVMRKNEYTIGRDPSCDVLLEREGSMSESDGSSISEPVLSGEKIRITVPELYFVTFSKIHFKITKDSSVVFLIDNSSNGTYVNGVKVGKGNKIILESNDQISLSNPNYTVYVFVNSSKYSIISETINYPLEIKDNFVVSRSLGKGSYGEVFLVFQKRTFERSAMKVVQKKTLTPMRDTITNEVTILKCLNHPCVINVYNVINSLERVFIFLPYMEGGDLFQKINTNKKLTEGVSKWFFFQIAKAVEYLHGQAIAHRDLKPENILLSSDKDCAIAKISDFGMSRFFDDQRVMQTLCGTPSYVAPEILETRGCGSYTNQVDVWSMGVILYACLSGSLPFKPDRPDLTLEEQICSGSYSFPDRHFKCVNKNAINLIERMMTVNPRNRIPVNMIPTHPWFKDNELVIKLRTFNLFQESDENEPPLRRRRLL